MLKTLPYGQLDFSAAKVGDQFWFLSFDKRTKSFLSAKFLTVTRVLFTCVDAVDQSGHTERVFFSGKRHQEAYLPDDPNVAEKIKFYQSGRPQL